jgi:arylsulfatase A
VITRRQFVESLVAGAASLSLAGCAKPSSAPQPHDARAPRPNLLVFLADDLGRECLGSYGGRSYETPALDRFAREGMRFERCFAMPMCHPSRTTLLTGRYPFRTNARWGTLPEDELTFGRLLAQSGYDTALAGKWQMAVLKDDPGHVARSGFARSAVWGWHEGARYWQPVIWVDGVLHPELADRYGPDVHSEFLIEFIETPREAPFLAFYPLTLPHFSSVGSDGAPGAALASYGEMVAELDFQVGRVLDALTRTGRAADTLVLFTADNGTPRRVVSKLGAREIQGGKSTLVDAGTHVPLLARWPGVVPAGSVCPALVDLSDLFPTLAALAGAPLPANVAFDGRSLVPLLRGEIAAERDWVYGAWGGRAYLRARRWKLYSSGELFDLERDPDEASPILAPADSAESAAARARLEAEYAALESSA